jgi:enterochelin esterase family protein
MRLRYGRDGALVLATLIAGIAIARAQDTVPPSGRLAALEAQLKADPDSRPLDSFWKDLEKSGTPIVEPVPGDPTALLVTLVWRASSAARQVFVFPQIESATSPPGKMKMNRLLDTDLWHRTYRLRVDSRFTYGFYEAPTVIENDGPLKHLEQLRTDPLNRQLFEFPPHDSVSGGRTFILSLFEASRAADRSWSIVRSTVQKGSIEKYNIASRILGAERRVWVYNSPRIGTAKVPALLILLDGFDYLHEPQVRRFWTISLLPSRSLASSLF